VRIGSIEVTAVIDATAAIDPVALWGSSAGAAGVGGATKGARQVDWAQHSSLLRADGRLDMPVGSFLVRRGDHLVLIDLGYGPEPPAGLSGGSLLANLGELGVRPGDITDVVFSHLHPDHVGWASLSGAATFPRATYHCHAEDWSHFVTASAVPGVAALLSPWPTAWRCGREHTGPHPGSTSWPHRGTRPGTPTSSSARAPNGPSCSGISCTARSNWSTMTGPGSATSTRCWPGRSG